MSRFALCVTVAIVFLAGCSDTSQRAATATEPTHDAATTTTLSTADQPTTSPAPLDWPGPVHDRGAVVQRMAAPAAEGEPGSWTWQDALDAAVPWVDVERVSLRAESQASWNMELAERPPLAAAEPGLLIAYGLVFDTNGDGVADHLVGIDNDAPKQGDFHVWVTDLRPARRSSRSGPRTATRSSSGTPTNEPRMIHRLPLGWDSRSFLRPSPQT